MRDSSPDVQAHRAWLRSFVRMPERGKVVDLGCGDGEDLVALAALYPAPEASFLGLDSSEACIAAALERSRHDDRLSFLQRRIGTRLPLADGTVDVIYSSDLFECIADPRALASDIARVLRPGGMVVVGHWDWDSQMYDGSDKDRVRRLVHAFADWQQGWMERADGWMGRRLWGSLAGSGRFDGAPHARVLTNTAFDPSGFGYRRAQDFKYLVDHGLVEAADYENFLREQAELAAQHRYFYSIVGFAYVGIRR